MTRLAVQNVSVTRAGRAILDRVSIVLPDHGLVGLLGPNGAGKSTLARLLAGQPAPHSGAVRLEGAEVARMPAARRAALVGYMPQSFVPHWDITARMLVEMGAARSPGLCAGAVREALHAEGLDVQADRLWSTLSGGERARATLAAVTVADPPVLVVDEPGASLDIRHRVALMRRLAQRGLTRLVIAVLHDIELATAWCDRLVLLDAGRVVADDAASAVARSGRLAEVFGLPFETVECGGVTVARPFSGRS